MRVCVEILNVCSLNVCYYCSYTYVYTIVHLHNTNNNIFFDQEKNFLWKKKIS